MDPFKEHCGRPQAESQLRPPRSGSTPCALQQGAPREPNSAALRNVTGLRFFGFSVPPKIWGFGVSGV